MDQTIMQIKERLEQERAVTAARVARIEGHRRRAAGALSADLEEQAQEQENDEVLDGLSSVEGDKLAMIEAALARIDAGVYGRCMNCNGKIKPARLLAMPFTTRCIRCAEKAEAGFEP
jgi:RNA polymerase-binding transcription factor DksA